MFDFNLYDFVIFAVVLLFSLTIHELSHGLAAYFLGDTTAKYDGRLSLNPLKHIDPIGMICMIIFKFGWAKPVMVNPRNFKNPKLGMALTAVMGPLSNFFLSFIFLLIFYPINIKMYLGPQVPAYVYDFIWQMFYFNLTLGIFNMLPIAPLDGSKVLFAFLPDNLYIKLTSGGRYGFAILAVLIWTGLLSKILLPIISFVSGIMGYVVNRIYFFL